MTKCYDIDPVEESAPEMLRVLRLVRGFFESAGPHVQLFHGNQGVEILNQVRAVIAKSEGK